MDGDGTYIPDLALLWTGFPLVISGCLTYAKATSKRGGKYPQTKGRTLGGSVHDPETGKAIIKNVLGKTQAEVKEKLKKAIEENVGIDYGRAKTYTVGNWLEVWYENYAKIKMRPSTYLTYHGYIENHIKPQLGKIPLNDLTTLHLQQFYKKLLAEGRVERIEAQKQPKGLSAKTVRNIHQIISSALKLAVEQRLIAHNPADGCALPKAERKSDLILSSIPLIESIFVALEIQPFDFRYS